MSNGKTALTLMMALALPGAGHALGLGEIHLDSAINEPLAADIDIVGATAEDLADITASIANRETFQQFGIDRPAFLSTVAFKISRDSRGRAVLAIRSKAACTEPLINMLVDFRWRGGELIRQYTLLLDPPGFVAAARVDAAASAPASVAAAVSVAAPISLRPAAAPALPPEKSGATAGEQVARKTIRVGAKATLRGVAWRVGARSDADLKRTMIAIFHANPTAFEGNINRLRRGALLTIPSAAQVAAISAATAHHEVEAQMQAWRASSAATGAAKTVASAAGTPVSSPLESAGSNPAGPGSAASSVVLSTGAVIDQHTPAASAAPSDAALNRKIQQLERSFDELRNRFDREHDALVSGQVRLTTVEVAPAPVAAPPGAVPGRGIAASIAAVLAFAAAALGLYAWRGRRSPELPRVAAESALKNPAPVQAAAVTAIEVAKPSRAPIQVESRANRVEPQAVPLETNDAAAAKSIEVDIEALEVSYLLQGTGGGLDDADALSGMDDTARLPSGVTPRADDSRADDSRADDPRSHTLPVATKLDYNLLDLDATVQHVQMPSALHENVGFKERRTSLADALKSAVEREPHRRDLRMKLLETYYAAAASNRQGFLDIVRKIAHERASLDEGEWGKIAWMGRQIASDDHLFAAVAALPDEDDLADCA